VLGSSPGPVRLGSQQMVALEVEEAASRGRRTVAAGGVLSKKLELISPEIRRAGGIPPTPPFRPPTEATFSDRTISSFSKIPNK
jgi:hypothetical protein